MHWHVASVVVNWHYVCVCRRLLCPLRTRLVHRSSAAAENTAVIDVICATTGRRHRHLRGANVFFQSVGVAASPAQPTGYSSLSDSRLWCRLRCDSSVSSRRNHQRCSSVFSSHSDRNGCGRRNLFQRSLILMTIRRANSLADRHAADSCFPVNGPVELNRNIRAAPRNVHRTAEQQVAITGARPYLHSASTMDTYIMASTSLSSAALFSSHTCRPG